MNPLINLAERVEAAKCEDNALDVLVEIAMFDPCTLYTSARSNAAGTKVIYIKRDGGQEVCWAENWTKDRADTAAALRAKAGEG